jgi:hypothetical protein
MEDNIKKREWRYVHSFVGILIFTKKYTSFPYSLCIFSLLLLLVEVVRVKIYSLGFLFLLLEFKLPLKILVEKCGQQVQSTNKCCIFVHALNWKKNECLFIELKNACLFIELTNALMKIKTKFHKIAKAISMSFHWLYFVISVEWYRNYFIFSFFQVTKWKKMP